MAKLKCVGGVCDGQKIWLENYRDMKDCSVRVPLPNFDLAIEFNPVNIPQILEVTFEVYIVDCLKYHHPVVGVTEIWFLRPKNFTIVDAIQFQFNKV